jgi:hypothetical protein
MPVSSALAEEPAFVGPLGGLLLSAVGTRSPMLVVRAARWWRDLARLGVHVPFFVAHDVGLLFAAPREQTELAARAGAEAAIGRAAGLKELVVGYRNLVAEISQTQASVSARSMKLSDDMLVVVLARILSAALRASALPAPWPATMWLDPEILRDLDAQLPGLFEALPRTYEAAALGAMVRARLQILTLSDALDLHTLRLLGMLGPETDAAGALAHVDLLAALSSPITNEIANFSLELLPNILETHQARVAGTHAAHGYAGVGRKGSIDSLVPTELAWEADEFARRALEGELLYYTREQAAEPAGRVHCILIDASASMRGEREVFARGLAIALAKKLQLGGEEVWMRFFDSRLYEVVRVRERGQVPAAWLLGFRGERGRNPARVFAQLATEIALLRAHDKRDLVVHLVTHAALHVPRHLVQEVRRLVHLFGVFILPSSGALDLEWLDLLEGHEVVDHAALKQGKTRARVATKIVDEAARVAVPGAVSAAVPAAVAGRA